MTGPKHPCWALNSQRPGPAASGDPVWDTLLLSFCKEINLSILGKTEQ